MSTTHATATRQSLLGASSAFRALLSSIDRVARTDSSVLLSGETGTGKDLVARTIHERSPRRRRAFVAVDCAGVSDGLFDSELFGHARGAFTGADRARPGRLLAADGGTLFLDGIDNLSLDGQARLLRVIQEREVLPLGESRSRRVDFRLLTSVSGELEGRMAVGHFRPDLYYRINVVELELPPLRQRRGDLPILAERFLRDTARRFGKDVRRLDSNAMRVLESYDWPGNVRELGGVLECAVASARGDILRESDLPVYVRARGGIAHSAGRSAPPADPVETRGSGAELPPRANERSQQRTFSERVEEFQRRLLVETLRQTGWSYRDCGEELGLTRHQVKYLCAKLGVRRSTRSR